MTTTISKQFSFGGVGVYNFNVQVYRVPGGTNMISTILITSTNMINQSKDLIDPYVPDLILFLANLVVEYNASYDAFHNQLDPYSSEESEFIADRVIEKANEIRQLR